MPISGSDPALTSARLGVLRIGASRLNVASVTPPAPPATPNTPSPATASTGAPAVLTWAAAGATSYDVYFGTAPTPVTLVSAGQAGASYAPTIAAGNIYYWQIVAINATGSTSGPVWSFTAAAPAVPGTPSPANTSTGQALAAGLSWAAVAGALVYDVYFGTSPTPPLVSTAQAGTTYAPGALTQFQTYYWRIVARNPAGDTTGPVWSFQTLSGATLSMTIAGAAPQMRVAGLTIRDLLMGAPNTCAFTVDTTAPTVGQEVKIGLGGLTVPDLIFAGTAQSVEEVYESLPANRAWRVECEDYTARVNRRRPFGSFVNTSASTIAAWLITNYAAGFTSTHVAAGLPTVSIVFDGSEDFASCLSKLTSAIGGYSYIDYGLDLHLFLEDTSDPPDPIDDAHPPLDEPAITRTTDLSQLRTRVYGKGHGEAVLADVLAAETILPIANAVMFNPAGGKAIAGTTPEASGSQIVNYAGIQIGGGGGLVGPGATPSSAPVAALAAGSEIETGAHDYAVTFVTAAGESLPGPRTTISVGPLARPSGAPTASAAQSGGSVPVGSHRYTHTYVTASGETLISSNDSATVSTSNIAEPGGGMTGAGSGTGGSGYYGTSTYRFRVTFTTAAGETTGSAETTVANPHGGIGLRKIQLSNIPTGPAGVTGRKLYRMTGGVWRYMNTLADNTTTSYLSSGTDISGNPEISSTNTAGGYQTFQLSNIPTGPAGIVTSRKIYRDSNGAGYLLLATIADNTTTTYTDTTSGLGAAPPATSTATANRVAITGIPIGGASVTQRVLYRTRVGSSQLYAVVVLADNTTTTYNDAYADASITAVAPVADASGLAQPPGQALAGSTSLLVAGTGAFSATGGWAVIGNGQQVIRYTGITGSSLTGIPATGPGAIVASIGYNSTITAAPSIKGVTGLAAAMSRGAPVNLWVQRDDTAAQAAMIALGDSDGIYEHLISDQRRGEASLIALCDADLALFSRPLVRVTYATRDPKTRSGKTIHVDLPAIDLLGDYTIQSVTIDEIDVAPGVFPRYTVEASSVRFSLEDVLRRLQL